MLSSLKNHPFSVEAFFDTSLVLTFALPVTELEPLIPECLTLDHFENKWAFIAVAMVQTSALRPKGFPKIFGNDFFLVGYRIFVRYANNAGKKLRGLYILKSETNSKKMELLGNIFTHYNYTTTDVKQIYTNNQNEIISKKSRFHLRFETETTEVELPYSSPFSDWKEARRFSGPLPFTFTYDSIKKKVLIIEGVREYWNPQPVRIIDYDFPFIRSLGLKGVVLANAFIINNIPYYWKKGRTETWNR